MSVRIRGEEYRVKNGKLFLEFKKIADIKEIEGLENVTNLKGLDLTGNEIQQIDDFPSFKELNFLNLSNNKISRISGLENLPKLKCLLLKGNHITKIENLKKLQELKWLDLSDNQIKKIEGIENLPRLRQVKFDGNPLEDFEENQATNQRISFTNCPECGGELEEGFINSPHDISWDKKEHTLIPGGEAVVESFVIIAETPAKRCPNCKIIIFNY